MSVCSECIGLLFGSMSNHNDRVVDLGTYDTLNQQTSHSLKGNSGWIFYIDYVGVVPVKKRVYMCTHDGCLYCFEDEVHVGLAASKRSSAIAVLPLAGVTIKTGVTATVTKAYGIQLKGQKITVELDADSLTNQNEWVNILKKEVKQANIEKLTQYEDPDDNKGVSEWYIAQLKEKQDAILRLREGTPMTKHFLMFGSRKEHERLLLVDEKGTMLSWRGNKSSDEDKGVAIDTIEEIVEGTSTKVLSSLSMFPERSACCWSVITPSRTVDFEAQTIAEKNRWVDNLRKIVDITRLEIAIETNRTSQRRPTLRQKLG